MLLPELNLPVNFAGKDGFYWWIGQIETEKDIKNTNRYKVRIVGQHVKSCTAVPVEDLPWAVVMLPVTAPSSEGNSNYSPAKLQKGDWVIGFFLDGADGQHPVIMGNLQKVTNSSKDNSISSNKSTSECLAFSRYVPPTNPYVALPDKKKSDVRPTNNNPVPAVVEASNDQANVTNQSARYACIQLADVTCKDTNQAKSRFEQVLSEFFGSVSRSGGQLGSEMISTATGKLIDYANAGKGYVNRAFSIARAYISAAKYQLLALIKKGVSSILKFCLGTPVPDGSPTAGKAKKQNRIGILATITKWLNDQLGLINCSIADLEAKLLDFLTNLFTDLITTIINSATCVIESFVSKILSEIETFLIDLIDAILGPLQAVLDIIASPLNILSAALKYVFDLLGISCTGGDGKCRSAEQTEYCTGSANKKKPGEDDFAALDKLISDIESDGVEPLQTSCEESNYLPCPSPTTAYPIGGEPDPNQYSGAPEIELDPADDPFDDFFDDIVIPDNDPTDDGTEEGTEDTEVILPVNADLNSEFILNLTATSKIYSKVNNLQTLNITSNAILNLIGSDGLNEEFVSSELERTIEPQPTQLLFTLSRDRVRVSNGETIKFTLTCTSGTVEDNTEFEYFMFGAIRQADFSNGKTSGKMKMRNNIAIETITISDNISILNEEEVLFSVVSARVSKNFFIYNTEVKNIEVPTSNPTFNPPQLGDPEVDDEGQIIDIPVNDSGDPYLFPPIIRIYGEGVGASASAILNESGKVVKIKINRPGRGYVPSRKNSNCVIDGFNIIKPGIGYTSPPIISVDGDTNIIKAVIDDRGYLIGVEIIDKTKVFVNRPRIEIYGGGGMGAKAIPSFSCFNTPTYNKYVVDVAPSGKDEVIDCP
jgi:hypothetical protein